MKVVFILQKESVGIVYFKEIEKHCHTYTSNIEHAMRFKSKEDAVDFNHKRLYGECSIVELRE